MFRRGLLMAFLCLSCQAVVAQKHVHGDGQLLIAQDQQQWQFQFILPAADLLGFEYVAEILHAGIDVALLVQFKSPKF
jgi:hypothetical protein